MSILDLSFKDICKSSNEFSFLSTIFDLVGNKQYKSSEYEALIEGKDNENTHTWLSLSAIGQDIGDVFLRNVNNFIDNLLNADTCGTNGLQSLASLLGINYTIFSIVNDFPNEIHLLIDVLSIKKEYLLDILQVNKKFAEYLCANCNTKYDTDYATESATIINKYRLSLLQNKLPLQYQELSSLWHSVNEISNYNLYEYTPQITNRITLSSNALNLTIFDIYYNFIMSKLTMTYNDFDNTKIYLELSNSILLSNFALYNENASEILKIKLQYNLRSNFNVTIEADNIDNGLSSIDDYSENERRILDIEFNYRHKPYSELQLLTRNKYYKEIEVKKYFDFVRNEYLNYDSSYLSSTQYEVDLEYFVLCTDYDAYKSLLNFDGSIKTTWISSVVDELIYITDNIRQLREQIKFFCLKNFMKGTFLLISYLINEYLKSNTIRSLNKLYNSLLNIFLTIPTFSMDSNYNTLVEYIDPIDYFNICADSDISALKYGQLTGDVVLSNELNKRYWQVNSTVDAIGAIDTTDVFSIPPTVNANVFAFDLATLSSFYYNIMNLKFRQYNISKLSATYTDHLSKFLSYVFDLGADTTYKDSNGLLVFNIEDNELSTYKEDLYHRYTADKNGEFPFYYFKNTIHPSYLIHPYLSSFMEKADYSYPILNIAAVARDSIINLIKDNLTSYIDANGYLQNIWNNPLGANLDYLSRYEISEHLDLDNNINPVLGYDGLFYPDAISLMLSDATFKIMILMLSDNLKDSSTISNSTTVLKNYYYHLSLTKNERAKIILLLKLLKQYFRNELVFSENNKIIYKYGLDLYQNAYILLKEKNENAYELKNANGTLWIRLKNHPIAFPAVIMTFDSKQPTSNNGYIANNDYSNLYFDFSDKSTTNNALWLKSETILLNNDIGILCELPIIQDFIISIDGLNIAILENCNVSDTITAVFKPCVLLVMVLYQYITENDMTVLMYSKVQSSKTDSNTEFLFKNTSNYKFGCFFNIFNKLAVCMYSVPTNNSIILVGSYYDYDNEKYPILDIKSKSVNLKYNIKNNTNVVFDANNDNLLVLGYIANNNISNVKNYIKKDFKYAEISQYLSRPLDNCIALNAFYVYNDFNLLNIDENSIDNKTALFESYTDNGFFGILSGNNSLNSTQIESELDRRGILKFLLLGKNKDNPIDFKLTIPIRMHEKYKTNDVTKIKNALYEDLSCASYEYAHFDTTIISAKDSAIAETILLKYDPLEVNKILNGNSTGLLVDEEYLQLLSSSLSNDALLYKQLIIGPYLIIGNIPDQYKKPGKQTYKASEDNFILNILESHTPISCSWFKNISNNEIQLDFNTTFYNNFSNNNYFNQQFNFLVLSKPGDAGYLNTYTSTGIQDVTYYIKNISDEHPKFLLSAFVETDIEKVIVTYNNKNIVTQDNKLIKI